MTEGGAINIAPPSANDVFFLSPKKPIFEFKILEIKQPQNTSNFVHLTDSPQFC